MDVTAPRKTGRRRVHARHKVRQGGGPPAAHAHRQAVSQAAKKT